MEKFKSRIRFNRQERSGIFYLLLLIVFLQCGYLILRSYSLKDDQQAFKLDEQGQAQYDSLIKAVSNKSSKKHQPFNPNYISDFKGYVLGMSTLEIDRLHQFRSENNYVNNPQQFQKVTQVSDSLLAELAPYFKFPDWKKNSFKKERSNKTRFSTKEKKPLKELNMATADDLKKVYGIGEKLSVRIVKFRDRLGGFLVDEQLKDVYGLEDEVVNRVLETYKVLHPPDIKKININTATVDELASLVYIKYSLAQKIVTYRIQVGQFSSLDELTLVEGFPKERIGRIKLYLYF